MSLRDELDRLVDSGLVIRRDEALLSLYHYTGACKFSGAWTYYTRLCRGVVLDMAGEIVARPFPKFFAVGERPETHESALPPEEPEVTEKRDGTLLAVWWSPAAEGWRASTTGDFDSPQARWGTDWLKPERTARLSRGRTYCFELTAPWNQIVVPYTDEVVTLLAVFDNQNGQDMTCWDTAKVARTIPGVQPLRLLTLDEARQAVADEAQTGKEGFVLRYSNGLRVKLKCPWYLTAHQTVSNFPVFGIWKNLASGEQPDLSAYPAAFRGWYEDRAKQITAKRGDVLRQVETEWLATPRKAARRDYELAWQNLPDWLRECLLAKLDGKPYDHLLWAAAEPRRSRESYRAGEGVVQG